MAISETRTTKNVPLLNNLNLNNYSLEFTPTETSPGGMKNEVESTFIEIANSKKSNIIVGVIYSSDIHLWTFLILIVITYTSY